MDAIADWIGSALHLDRPLVDRTGLKGTFDVTVEYENLSQPNADLAPGSVAQPTPPDGTGFLDALGQQLGLKVQSTTAPIRTLVVDHIEQLKPN